MAVAAASSTTAANSDASDGPVLSVINKRLRNLRKKLNRISQMEDALSQGKSINKEQEEVLLSKPSVLIAIDELEKLRGPISLALNDEIALAIAHQQTLTTEDADVGAEEGNDGVGDEKVRDDLGVNQEASADDKVSDLLTLLYFGTMFDVKSQSDFNSVMLTRTHERSCCLAYDYVTDDDNDVMLGERDLDFISALGSLLVSRPVDSSLSHQNALGKCVERAKLWLERSHEPVDADSTVTYAGLREKLTKILGSEFFTITPEMKATVDVAAAAGGNYGSFQVPAPVEVSDAQYEQDENSSDFQRSESYDGQSSPIEESHKDDEAEILAEISGQAQATKPHVEEGFVTKEQNHAPRRQYQNHRVGGRNGGGFRGGHRGYSNGRGGRGGRGGVGQYVNGRNQYYDQPGNNYQRNHYNNRGRGGVGGGSGRGGVGNTANHASGVQAVNS